MRYKARPGKPGFTLLELLIVITVIAILMLLLFPGVAYARFKARCMACVANVRTWGLATVAYAADNNGTLTRYDAIGGLNGCTWDIGIMYYTTNANGTINPTNALLGSYGINMLQSYYCPFNVTGIVSLTSGQIYTRGGGWGTLPNYIYWVERGWVPGVGSYPSTYPLVDIKGDYTEQRKVNNVRDPTRYPIMSDCLLTSPGASNELDSAGYHQWRDRTDNVNVVFVDGHVEVRKRSEFRIRCRNNPYPLDTWF